MKKEIDISVIIPVHKLENDIDKQLFERAYKSVSNETTVNPSKIIVVSTKDSTEDVKTILSTFDNEIETLVLENTDVNTDFASMVKFGVDKSETVYFSILELDDEFTKTYWKHIDKYINKYQDCSLFLPLVGELSETGKFIKYSNETAFNIEVATNLSIELGELSHTALNKTPSFLISGGVFKKDDFNEIGGIKNNIKLTYIYEYLLRATNHDQKIIVLPKLGYIHRNGRPNSITMSYLNEETAISQDEIKFWFDTAKKEFYFKKQRNLEYKPKVETVEG